MHAQRTGTPDVLDICGRRRSPATLPGFAAGRPPRNKGRKYPPKPIGVEQIVTFPRAIPDTPEGRRLRALAIMAWRSGLRVAELCALDESDSTAAITPSLSAAARAANAASAPWTTGAGIAPWLDERRQYPIGALFPVLHGPTAGRPLATTIVRAAFRKTTARSGLRVRIHPHALRHAVELWRENVDIYTISRQLGHANVAITAHYPSRASPRSSCSNRSANDAPP